MVSSIQRPLACTVELRRIDRHPSGCDAHSLTQPWTDWGQGERLLTNDQAPFLSVGEVNYKKITTLYVYTFTILLQLQATRNTTRPSRRYGTGWEATTHRKGGSKRPSLHPTIQTGYDKATSKREQTTDSENQRASKPPRLALQTCPNAQPLPPRPPSPLA